MTITGTVARYAILRTARAHAIVTRVRPGAEDAGTYLVEVHPAPDRAPDPRDPHAWAARAQFTRCDTWREATAYAARALTSLAACAAVTAAATTTATLASATARQWD